MSAVLVDFTVHNNQGRLSIANPPDIGGEVVLSTYRLAQMAGWHGVYVDDGQLHVLDITLEPLRFEGGGLTGPLRVVCRRVA